MIDPWWLFFIVPASAYAGFIFANHLWVRAGAVIPKRRTPDPLRHVSDVEGER